MLLNKTHVFASFLGMLCFLSACEMATKNQTLSTPVHVQERVSQIVIPTHQINSHNVFDQAEAYKRNGVGVFEVRVTYNPSSTQNDSTWARQKANSIGRKLKKAGVDNVISDILPVKNLTTSQAIMRYKSYHAKAPDICSDKTMDSSRHDVNNDYLIGCTMSDLFAKQIYRSTDLLDQTPPVSSQNADRAAAELDFYRLGGRNEPLETESTRNPSE